MAPDKPKTRKEFEAMIVANAWKDPRYQRRLLADPKGVVQSELEKMYKGAALPPGMNVYVHEEGPNDVHLVLPRNPQDFTPQELSDDDLDQVAGGTGIGVVVAAVVAGVVNTAGNTNQIGNVNINTNANINLNANLSVNLTSTTTS
jgi:hypothetical protein